MEYILIICTMLVVCGLLFLYNAFREFQFKQSIIKRNNSNSLSVNKLLELAPESILIRYNRITRITTFLGILALGFALLGYKNIDSDNMFQVEFYMIIIVILLILITYKLLYLYKNTIDGFILVNKGRTFYMYVYKDKEEQQKISRIQKRKFIFSYAVAFFGLILSVLMIFLEI